MNVPVASLSRLNVHARASSGHAIARAIYAYKELAALVACLDELATLRFVVWQGKCSRCENGRYSHWDWTDGYTVRCRDCRGTGIRTLRFTETRFATGQVWHHPWNGAAQPGRVLATKVLGAKYFYGGGLFRGTYDGWETEAGQAIDFRPVVDWKPLESAEKIPLAELVPLLNQVEDWMESSHSRPAFGGAWIRECAQRHLFKPPKRDYWEPGDPPSPGYSLDLGRVPGGCFVCGDAPSMGYGRYLDQLAWSLPVCKRHSAGPEKAEHPKDPPLASLITPDIQRWLDRHSRVAPRRW